MHETTRSADVSAANDDEMWRNWMRHCREDLALAHWATLTDQECERVLETADIYQAVIFHEAPRLLEAMSATGALRNLSTDTGLTIMHWSVLQDHAPMIEALLVQGINPNCHNLNGVTPLHIAITNEATCRLLLRHGADIMARDHTGNTPLHRAVLRDYANIIPFLLDAGADPSATNHDGETPLQVAQRIPQPACAAILLASQLQRSVASTHRRRL